MTTDPDVSPRVLMTLDVASALRQLSGAVVAIDVSGGWISIQQDDGSTFSLQVTEVGQSVAEPVEVSYEVTFSTLATVRERWRLKGPPGLNGDEVEELFNDPEVWMEHLGDEVMDEEHRELVGFVELAETP